MSCHDNPDKNRIYFGGEILNPESPYVLLMQNEKVLDSIKINPDNSFGKYYTDLKPGLYFFKHGNEFQYLFLEPQDSIKIRLNTWDFDESLVFDGRGSEKNDFLLSVFLRNEKEMDNFYSYFTLSEKDFEKKYNEAYARNYDMLMQFFRNTPDVSESFKHLAEGSVTYPLYRFKELYPYYHQKLSHSDSVTKVSPEFYAFRKNVDLNDNILSEYYIYQNYISSYLYNEANKANQYKELDENFKTILLNSIVEKISNKELKDRLLYQEMVNYLFRSKEEVSAENLDLFYKNCDNKEYVSKIKNVITLKNNLPIGSKLPDFELIDENNTPQFILKLIKGKTSVLYFWTSDYSAASYIKSRINLLANKYPNVKFIGVHIDKANFEKLHIPMTNQYYFTSPEESKKLVSEDFPRTIIVDNEGNVVDNYSIITHSHIENHLEKL